jgi:hypothetical protein
MRLIFLIYLLVLPVTLWADTITFQVSHYDDEYIATVFGSTDITEEFSMNAEVDTTGYLELGGGYGVVLGQWYIEGFASYGRADNIDVYDLGGLVATSITKKFTVYFISYYQWRETKGFPILELDVFDQQEWKNSLGLAYTPIHWFEVSISGNYDLLTSRSERLGEVENKGINSQDLTLTFKPKWVEPFIRYTTGTHRVRPGEPITRDDSVEIGISAKF